MQYGRIARLLKLIRLIEIISLFTLKTLLNIFIMRRFQIDTLWLMPNLALSASSIALFSFGIRDHRAFIVDFQLESILGDDFISIAKSKIC